MSSSLVAAEVVAAAGRSKTMDDLFDVLISNGGQCHIALPVNFK